jgi:type IV pilus assembly protein PilM
MQSSVVDLAAFKERMAHSAAREVTQAVSVAAAYFEDTLQASPDTILVAGTLGAETLAAMMDESGLQGLRVQEIVDAGMMQAGAVTSTVAQMPKGWLAGVRGALKN